MDLKQFIKETIEGIVDAIAELQPKLEENGAIINPPINCYNRDLYEHEQKQHVFRRVEIVEFDVAVTAGSETGGTARAGLKVLSFEAGGDARHGVSSERVSRVKFSVPIVLSPAAVEQRNKNTAERAREQQNEQQRPQSRDGW